MTWKNVKISWQQSASEKSKCVLCSKKIFGKEGYIHISGQADNFWSRANMNICWECVKDFFRSIKRARLTKESKWKDKIKEQMLRNLR